MSQFPTASPFKLLQAYDKGDTGIYFGRENETLQLSEALMRSKFLLLYGASGTGKTSLIQCGLPGMFSPRDWLPIFVRRGVDFVESLRVSVLEQYRARFELRYPGRPVNIPADLPLRDAIKRLFSIAYVPVYLILDQFEEIFTLGDEAEQDRFFNELAALRLFEDDLFCKFLIVTREEYIAHFYRYEKELPFLFEQRFRVEKMRREQLQQVVEGTLGNTYTGYPHFVLEPGAGDQILRNLTDARGETDLTDLQVYLDRLYRDDLERRPAARGHVLFDVELVGENKLENVLSEFLDQQVAAVSRRLSFDPASGRGSEAVLQVLFKLVTAQGTKQNRAAAEIHNDLKVGKLDISDIQLQACLDLLAAPDIRLLNRLTFANAAGERYEIWHDRLAEQVFKKFNAEEIRQREALVTLENKKKRFAEMAESPKRQRQEYLSLGELELVEQSLNIDRLHAEQQFFFRDSRNYHVRRRRRERWVAMGSAAAAAVFFAVAVVAWIFFQRAQRAEKQALANEKRALENEENTKKALAEAEANLHKFYEARYEDMVKRAENYVALRSPAFALYEYQAAQQFWKDTLYAGQKLPDTLSKRIERIRADLK